MKVYLYDPRHTGDLAHFWRPKGEGYTAQVPRAGLFDLDDPIVERALGAGHVAIPEEIVTRATIQVVGNDAMQSYTRSRKAMGAEP